MAINNEDILPLIFWITVLGLTVFAASKAVGHVSNKVGDVFS